jgi:tetratricopeptide (TPR) repeat protein
VRKQKTAGIFFFEIFLLSIYILFISPRILEAFETGSSQIPINYDIIRGIELLYDLEFDQAQSKFCTAIAEEPKHPMGYFYLAMVPWFRLANGFWSPEIVRLYGERIDQAISVARNRIENEEEDSFTYFYLGGALGFKGRFQLMHRNWLSSYRLAYEAINALKICSEMDPNNKDVLFGLGIFDYYTARLSGFLKFLTSLFLHRGDKNEGLRKLHIAAKDGIYSAIEAKSTLIHIYLFLEEDFCRARPLAEELAERFKKDPRNKYLQGLTYIRLGMEPEYREVTDYFNQRSENETSLVMASIWRKQAFYLEASYYLFHGQYDMARSKLEAILSRADSKRDPFMIAWPLLKIGMSYDLENKGEAALKYYNRILAMENGAGAQFLAEKYVDEPLLERDPFIGY